MREYKYKHPFRPNKPPGLATMTDREVFEYVEKQLGIFDYETDFHYAINLDHRLTSEEKFQMLAPALQMFEAAYDCGGSVFGDGLYSYFGYGCANHAQLAVETFRRIGEEELAAVLAEAMSLFGPEYPADGSEREALLAHEEEWMAKLEPYNSRFQTVSDAAGDIVELMGHYIRDHPLEFFEHD